MPTTPRPPREQPGAEAAEGAPEAAASASVDAARPVLAKGTRNDIGPEARAAKDTLVPEGTRDDAVAALAHDLKNPLTIIMLEANQIEQRLGTRTTPAVLRGLERIAQNAAYVDRLVSDLLDTSAAEAGRLELQTERVDLARLLREAITRAVPTPDRPRVRLEIRDILFVIGDGSRIERVVANLLGNALKYSPVNGLVTLRLDRRGAYACVSVIDAGPGLTAEEARRVFERYRRGSAGTQKGYGLGLHTSRTIIEAHRGRIGVVSTPGKGARFYFELPVA